jgi:hypothetical protein
MTEPVRWQYLPRGTAAHQREACVLHAAKWLRSAVTARGVLPPRPDPTLLHPLHLTAAKLEFWLPEIRARLDAIGSLLQAEEPAETTALQFPGGTRAIATGGTRGPVFG